MKTKNRLRDHSHGRRDRRCDRRCDRRRGRVASTLDLCAAQYGLDSLMENRPIVSLAPAPIKIHENHKIRIVEQKNPNWFRDLCSSKDYQSSIRKRIIRLLNLVKERSYVPPGPWNMTEQALSLILEEMQNLFLI